MISTNADVYCSAEHAEQSKSSTLALPSNTRHVLELNYTLDEANPDMSHCGATAEQPDPPITDIASCSNKIIPQRP